MKNSRSSPAPPTAPPTAPPVNSIVPRPPVNTLRPSIPGPSSVKAGSVLKAGRGVWSNNPTRFEYQWYSVKGNNIKKKIPNQTATSYKTTPRDIGLKFSHHVKASNAGGSSAPAFSNQINVVPPPPPPNTTILQYNSFQGNSFTWGGVIFNLNTVYGLPPNSYISNITSIPALQVSGFANLTNVTIGNSVTIIGANAFNQSNTKSVLTSVIFTPTSSVTSIGFCAFLSCTALTSIIIPNSVTSIGASAFAGSSRMVTVTIGNSVTSIGASAFFECTALTSIIIPNSVTSLGASAFDNNSALATVTIGNSVTSISPSAFQACSALTSVTFTPNSLVNSIGNYAFNGCSALKSISIPYVTTIGPIAFASSGLTNNGPIGVVTINIATAFSIGISGNPTSFFGATNVNMNYI